MELFNFENRYEFFIFLCNIIYPVIIGFLNFFIIIGLWLWFKHPVYLFKLYKWYIFQKYQMRRSFINIDSVIIHIAEINVHRKDRTSLLFINGVGGHLLNWSQTIKHLDRQRDHIISIDLPGYGLSYIPFEKSITVDDCINYIRESIIKIGLENQDLHVIGQSFCGYIAGAYAIKYSNTVKLLSLVAPAGFGNVKNEFYSKIIKNDYSWIMPMSMEEIHNYLERCMYRPPQIPNQLLSGILQDTIEKYHYVDKMMKLWTKYNINGIFTLSGQIRQPTQVIWGVHDQLLPVENAHLLQCCLINCVDKTIIGDCGHSVHLEKPNILATVITEFRNKKAGSKLKFLD